MQWTQITVFTHSNHTKQCIIVIKLDQIYIWLICLQMIINWFASNAMEFVHFKCFGVTVHAVSAFNVNNPHLLHNVFVSAFRLDQTETSLAFLW